MQALMGSEGSVVETGNGIEIDASGRGEGDGHFSVEIERECIDAFVAERIINLRGKAEVFGELIGEIETGGSRGVSGGESAAQTHAFAARAALG